MIGKSVLWCSCCRLHRYVAAQTQNLKRTVWAQTFHSYFPNYTTIHTNQNVTVSLIPWYLSTLEVAADEQSSRCRADPPHSTAGRNELGRMNLADFPCSDCFPELIVYLFAGFSCRKLSIFSIQRSTYWEVISLTLIIQTSEFHQLFTLFWGRGDYRLGTSKILPLFWDKNRL